MGRMNGTALAAVPFLAALGCMVASFASAQIASSSPQASKTSVDPAFEVATIKPSNPMWPSDPNEAEWAIGTRGDHFWAHNATVIDLISFAYEVHAKQIAGEPPWCRTERFDIEGVPNFEGRPVRTQLQTMLRKLLADRFQLQVHTEKQQLEVYALVVASGGARFHKSDAPHDAHPGYGFPTIVPVSQMKVTAMTMPAFASALQRTVLDKPVVDQTGLPDRYDFALEWTPDESQFIPFRGTGVVVTSGSKETNAPPGLFTAIQNQLGLKLEAKRAMDDVVVISHIEKPSAN